MRGVAIVKHLNRANRNPSFISRSQFFPGLAYAARTYYTGEAHCSCERVGWQNMDAMFCTRPNWWNNHVMSFIKMHHSWIPTG